MTCAIKYFNTILICFVPKRTYRSAFFTTQLGRKENREYSVPAFKLHPPECCAFAHTAHHVAHITTCVARAIGITRGGKRVVWYAAALRFDIGIYEYVLRSFTLWRSVYCFPGMLVHGVHVKEIGLFNFLKLVSTEALARLFGKY